MIAARVISARAVIAGTAADAGLSLVGTVTSPGRVTVTGDLFSVFKCTLV